MQICNYKSTGGRAIRRAVSSGARVHAAATDTAAEFARSRLGFEPDQQQEWVLSARRKRLLLNCTRQWGKSTVTAIRAIYEAEQRPGTLVIVAAPTGRQSGELVRKAAALMRYLGRKPRGDGQNEISLLFPNGSRIVGLPGREATVRGFSAPSLVIVDEAARVPDGLYMALRPMLATSGGDLWLLSTPFGKRGFFYEEWASGGPGWNRVAVPAAECPRIPADFLAQEAQTMGDEWFRQEYCCEFRDVNAGIFGRELVESAVQEDIEPLDL